MKNETHNIGERKRERKKCCTIQSYIENYVNTSEKGIYALWEQKKEQNKYDMRSFPAATIHTVFVSSAQICAYATQTSNISSIFIVIDAYIAYILVAYK